MEGKSRLPEITIVAEPRPVGAVDVAKTASKEPVSPGTPSPSSAGGRSKESLTDGGVPLPGWKLDELCRESGPSAPMMARFPYF